MMSTSLMPKYQSCDLCTPGLQPYVSQAGVAALNFFGYINAFLLMLIILIWSRALHSRLRHALICMSRRNRTPRHTFYTHSHLDATYMARTASITSKDSCVRALPLGQTTR